MSKGRVADPQVKSKPRAQKSWESYIEAKLGFRNYWYPAFFSNELEEAEISPGLAEGSVTNIKVLKILGERLLFRRVDGRVYALEDECIHKGSPFSVKPRMLHEVHDYLLVSWIHLRFA